MIEQANAPTAVVFDLGGVLIDWDPRYLYRSILPDEAAVDDFLREVGFGEWNLALDAGRDWDEAVEWLAERHPERRELIEAFRDRWEETLGDADRDVVAIAAELRAAGVRTFALSNWSARTFEVARQRFPFLADFEGIVISGDVGAIKPDAAIYRALLERFELDPRMTVFIDDRRVNIEAAQQIGIGGIEFSNAADLRRRLRAAGLPLAPDR
ncbi:MAG TPA: HAD family phosphatase [Candidatus Limnocylindrales bacterium]|nr:HAD family phosphatase [Candidatus Limnocylindrales bacterium]